MALRTGRMTRLATRVGGASAMAMTLLALVVAGSLAAAGAPQDGGPGAPDRKTKDTPPPAKTRVGLLANEPGASPGYALLNPMNHKNVYLIDREGRVVRTWESEHQSAHAAYLLEDGHVLRVGVIVGAERAFGGGPGTAGRVQEFDWDGRLVWDFQLRNDKQLPHHDACKMPNGHVLLVVWDKKTAAEATAAGRKKELVGDYLLPDSVLEIKPTGKTTGEVVWEWHLWDHLIQDHDATQANYGDVASHPERVDINFLDSPMGPGPGGPPGPAAKGVGPGRDPAKDALKKAEAEKLKTLGYVGSPQQRRQRVNPDWTHVNSVDYNPDLDQIVLSVHELSEIWIIDHGTTTAEAAGHTGGRRGRGGDLLYRWGNPRAYRAGTKADQTLFGQHNAHWIPRGLPGAGHMLVFNNGGHRPDGTSYTTIDELVLPIDEQGRYRIEPGAAYGPKEPVWSYSASKKSDFYAFFISGAHRLPNGNTFVCSGPNGTLFEVTPDKRVVWRYANPVVSGFPPPGFGPGGPPPMDQLLPGPLQDRLGLSPEQRKDIEALQQTVDETLDQTLTEAQKKTLNERRAPGPAGFAAMPAPGQVLSVSTQVALKPTPEQRTTLADLQKTVDARLDKLLTDDQKKELKQIRADFARGPGGGGPPRGPGGGPAGNGVFRAYKYTPDYPGLAGKDLKPGKTVEEMQPKSPPKG